MKISKTTATVVIHIFFRFLVCVLCYFGKRNNTPQKPVLRKVEKSSLETRKVMVYVDEGIWTEILLRMPVECVVKFRCVSKSLRLLTTNPHFIKAHLNLSPDKIISSPVTYLLPFYFISPLHNTDVELPGCRGYHYPYYFPALNGSENPSTAPYNHAIGTCNGLVCIHRHPSDHILWNPSNRKFRVLPPSGTQSHMMRMCDVHYGFGYDALNDDYKLVEPTAVLRIYSSRANSWKIILDCPLNDDVIFYSPSGIFSNGALHWIVTYRDQPNIRKIFIVNITTEVCNFICARTPCHKNAYDGDVIRKVVLGASRDRLWLSYNLETHMDIWRLSEKQELGWSKFMCVKAESWAYFPMKTKLLHILDDGCAFILYNNPQSRENKPKGLRIYKPTELDVDHVYGGLIYGESFIYRESLVIP